VGNIRLSYAKNAATNEIDVVDRNDYYPFGLSFYQGAEFSVTGSPLNYKFGGKELQESGMYDFGARNYMPDVGRWFGADPLAELAPDLSPYRYAFNNPISFTDPTGMYEGDGGGDWDEENDRDERDYGRDMDKGPSLLSFAWSEDARNNEDSDINIFEKSVLILLNLINGDFRVNFDAINIRSGGDGNEGNDFGQDMSQENSSNDMMNYAYPDQTKPNSQQQKAAWDTNGDGKLQKSEADQWYLHGNGVTINVDNSKIDWSGLKMPVSGSPQFAISTTDAFISLPWETASTYGGTSFERINPTTAIVKDQPYHYNLRPNNSLQNVVRNFMNEAGKPGGTNYGGQHGNTKGTKEGKPFMIHYLNPTIKFNSK